MMSDDPITRLNAAPEGRYHIGCKLCVHRPIRSPSRWTMVAVASVVICMGCDSQPTAPSGGRSSFVEEQLLGNGDVEGGGGAPDAWRAGPARQDLVLEWSDKEAASGTRSLAIRSMSKPDSLGGFWAQTVPVSNTQGLTFQLTASVKLEDMTGAGVSIAVRGDVSSSPNHIAEAFATTQGRQVIIGTGDWRSLSVSLYSVPATVDQLTVYLIYLPGSTGAVFFDDVKLSVRETPPISSEAATYIQFALTLMRTYSVNRYSIDWEALRARVFEEAGPAQSYSDTYGAIRFALRALGDHHSGFSPPGPGGISLSTPPAPSAKLLGGRIGYLSVPRFLGGGRAADSLATTYHQLIEGVDSPSVCGWVVDLRGNTGGNMWPMLAGVGPIVGEGVLGFAVDPDSVVQPWTYADGVSFSGGFRQAQASDPYALLASYPPVAVLTDSLTASSGEGTTIAFRGRADARSFGTPTWGASTGRRNVYLMDGAVMHLAVSTMADRTGRLYGGTVDPDERVEGDRTGDPQTDPPLNAGMEWLLSQPACQAP